MASEHPPRTNLQTSWLSPIERLALVEHRVEEMAESFREMQEWRGEVMSRLWLLDILTGAVLLFKEPAVKSLRQAVELLFNGALLYIAVRIFLDS